MADPDIFGNLFKTSGKRVIKLRRDLHQIPEPAFREYKTSAYICAFLKKAGIPFKSGIAGTGVLAKIKGKSKNSTKGPVILLRADMDAVPIPEEKTGLPFSSKNRGYMHACGHDAHTAMLLMTGSILWKIKKHLKGSILLLFQPAEESLGGGREIVKSGIIDLKKVDMAAALHIWGALKAGQFGYIPGKAFAFSDRFDIMVAGKGGHGASPYKAKDPITAAAQIISALNTIVSRKVKYTEKAVISFGAINGGNTYNVIPDNVHIIGTFRTLNPKIRKFIQKEIERTSKFTARATGLQTHVSYVEGYPLLINDENVIKAGKAVAEPIFGKRNIIKKEAIMGGEDFSYFLQKVPGAMFLVGGAKGSRETAHHNAEFDIDESVLIKGVEFLCRLTTHYMEK